MHGSVAGCQPGALYALWWLWSPARLTFRCCPCQRSSLLGAPTILQYSKVEELHTLGLVGHFTLVWPSALRSQLKQMQHDICSIVLSNFLCANVLEKEHGEMVLQVCIPLLLQEMKHVSVVSVRPG